MSTLLNYANRCGNSTFQPFARAAYKKECNETNEKSSSVKFLIRSVVFVLICYLGEWLEGEFSATVYIM